MQSNCSRKAVIKLILLGQVSSLLDTVSSFLVKLFSMQYGFQFPILQHVIVYCGVCLGTFIIFVLRLSRADESIILVQDIEMTPTRGKISGWLKNAYPSLVYMNSFQLQEFKVIPSTIHRKIVTYCINYFQIARYFIVQSILTDQFFSPSHGAFFRKTGWCSFFSNLQIIQSAKKKGRVCYWIHPQFIQRMNLLSFNSLNSRNLLSSGSKYELRQEHAIFKSLTDALGIGTVKCIEAECSKMCAMNFVSLIGSPHFYGHAESLILSSHSLSDLLKLSSKQIYSKSYLDHDLANSQSYMRFFSFHDFLRNVFCRVRCVKEKAGKMFHYNVCHALMPGSLGFYLILAFVDVQGGVFSTLAFGYANLANSCLIDWMSLLTSYFLSVHFMREKVTRFKILSLILGFVGSLCIFTNDLLPEIQSTFCLGSWGPSRLNVDGTYLRNIEAINLSRIDLNLAKITFFEKGDKRKTYQQEEVSRPAASVRIWGDIFSVAGAILLGIASVMLDKLVATGICIEEILVKTFSLATLIALIEFGCLEYKDINTLGLLTWSGWLFFFGSAFFMSCLYSLSPVIMKQGGSAFFNLSLMTSAGLLVLLSALVLKDDFPPLYSIGLIIIISSILIYHQE